jgi:hypothetical protein
MCVRAEVFSSLHALRQYSVTGWIPCDKTPRVTRQWLAVVSKLGLHDSVNLAVGSRVPVSPSSTLSRVRRGIPATTCPIWSNSSLLVDRLGSRGAHTVRALSYIMLDVRPGPPPSESPSPSPWPTRRRRFFGLIVVQHFPHGGPTFVAHDLSHRELRQRSPPLPLHPTQTRARAVPPTTALLYANAFGSRCVGA